MSRMRTKIRVFGYDIDKQVTFLGADKTPIGETFEFCDPFKCGWTSDFLNGGPGEVIYSMHSLNYAYMDLEINDNTTRLVGALTWASALGNQSQKYLRELHEEGWRCVDWMDTPGGGFGLPCTDAAQTIDETGIIRNSTAYANNPYKFPLKSFDACYLSWKSSFVGRNNFRWWVKNPVCHDGVPFMEAIQITESPWDDLDARHMPDFQNDLLERLILETPTAET